MQASINAVEALWICHPLIEIPLAAIMYRRKLHRQFPIFFAYILFNLVCFAILFPLYRSDSSMAYFFAYWIGAIACWVFGFKVIREILLDVFRRFPDQKKVGLMLFRWAALVAAGSVLLLVVSTSAGPDTSLVAVMIAIEKCVRIAQCALIFLLLLFCRHMGISWRQQSIGIVLGFGWFAGVEVIAFMLYSGRAIHQSTLDLLNVIAYSLSLIAWIAYTAFPGSDALHNVPTGKNSFIVDGEAF
jgi:hypothetical protein